MAAAKSSSTAHGVATVIMDVFVGLVAVLVAHLVVRFFGVLSGAAWGAGLVRLTSVFVLPMGFAPVATPYGGVFDVDAAGTGLALIALEWMLGLVRRTV